MAQNLAGSVNPDILREVLEGHPLQLFGKDAAKQVFGNIADESVSRGISDGSLPRPIKLGGRNYWHGKALRDFLRDRLRAGGYELDDVLRSVQAAAEPIAAPSATPVVEPAVVEPARRRGRGRPAGSRDRLPRRRAAKIEAK